MFVQRLRNVTQRRGGWQTHDGNKFFEERDDHDYGQQMTLRIAMLPLAGAI